MGYVGALFADQEYRKGCAIVDAHPQALTEDALLDTPMFAPYRVLAAECAILPPVRKSAIRASLVLATKAVDALKRGSDREMLGLAYYVRGIIYANLGNVAAARSDLRRAADLGNKDAADLLNG